MGIFNSCKAVNNYLINHRENDARNLLIKLLDYLNSKHISYTPLINHLIRETGLYPYLQIKTSCWQDKFVYQAFKVDIGNKQYITLHREQSSLLKSLLDGKSIAVSAPTSFGKSFVIDAFISLNKPNNVVIIVPTIALTDETRRRIYKKFSNEYKIITTPDEDLSNKNILIFPQERAINYIEKISLIDILIIDEFYKAGISFDKERAPILLKAILELGKKAKQKYFLAPNITSLKDSPFTKGMKFEKIDFNTVISEIHEEYLNIDPKNKTFNKGERLLSILNTKKTKSLIYAGTYSNIKYITNILRKNLPNKQNELLKSFFYWLKNNYGENFVLSDLVLKGVGIHNGHLHRSLSQLQIKLFEEYNGLDNIVSTSSIIEGVNTSAENVIIWANKNGKPLLNDFTYKNIIGRGGRMFKHFIGKIYLFEAPPKERAVQLELDVTEDFLNTLDINKFNDVLSMEQISKIRNFYININSILGEGVYKRIISDPSIQSCNSDLIQKIAIDMKNNQKDWKVLRFLNSNNPQDWRNALFKVLNCTKVFTGSKYRIIVDYIKEISNNWNNTIPEIINLLNKKENIYTVEKYFELERFVSFKLSLLLSDINVIQKYIIKDIYRYISFYF